MAGGIINWVFRGTQFLFTLLVLSLIASIIQLKPSGNGNPSEINYLMFASVFGMLSLIFTIVTSFVFSDSLGAPMIILILDSLNTVFWFCGAVALAAALGVHNCNNDAYLLTNKVTNAVVNGQLTGSSQICREAQASTAFAWFLFAAYLGSAVFFGLRGVSGGSIKTGRMPPMSHV